jgi:hypothetical protein
MLLKMLEQAKLQQEQQRTQSWRVYPISMESVAVQTLKGTKNVLKLAFTDSRKIFTSEALQNANS